MVKRKKRKKTNKKTKTYWRRTKQTLYKVQPARCRKRLPQKRAIKNMIEPKMRVFTFNPKEMYDRINKKDLLNPFMRTCSVNMIHLFPKKSGICNCGCGKNLKGRQRRWASPECSRFVSYVYDIVSGRASTIRHLLYGYYGGFICSVCGVNDSPENPIELDHIYPVHKGGGGCWLSNYDFKCKSCHKEKTKEDLIKYK